MKEEPVNAFVKLLIDSSGRCHFVASLGGREYRKSHWYDNDSIAMKDYSRGRIRWQKGKVKK